MSSNQRRDSREHESPRVEPSFFGNQLRNNQSQPKQPKRQDETDWEHPPPPYSPPEEPSSLYPSSSTTPSAPPLPESIPPVNPNYQRHPTYSTSDIYPPQNYNQSYGSIQQPTSPSSPHNTSDARTFHWPWRVDSATPSIPDAQSPLTPQPHQNSPPPPQVNTTPTKKKSCCRLFLLLLCILFVFLLISNIVSFLFGGETIHMCTGGVPWAKLPHELTFDDNLRISTSGGQLTGGRITLKNTDKEHPSPAIFVQSRVSPSDFAEIPGLDYSVVYNQHETYLNIKIPDSSHVCLSMDLEIYVNNSTKIIALDVQNSPIRIDGEAMPHTTTLKIKTTNSPIHFNAPWTGSVLALETTNGNIELRGTVTANSTVSLRTTNNHISTVDILSRDVISITSTNGYITTGKLSAGVVKVMTDNAMLTVDSIHADQVDLSTTNGKLMVPSANVSSTIKAYTKNALLELDLRKSNEEVVVIAETNNNPASLLMPPGFQGTFVIRTTGRSEIILKEDNTRIKTHIYEVAEGYLNGARYADKIMGGHITFKTTNSPIHLSFLG